MIKSLNLERDSCDATLMDGCIVVAGGTSNARPLSSVEKYDPIKNEWINLAAMNKTRYSIILGNISGFLYAMGGNDVLERYDPSKNEWQTVSEQNFCRLNGGETTVSNKSLPPSPSADGTMHGSKPFFLQPLASNLTRFTAAIFIVATNLTQYFIYSFNFFRLDSSTIASAFRVQ